MPHSGAEGHIVDLAKSLCCVLGHDNLLSLHSFPPRSVHEYQHIKANLTSWGTEGNEGGGEQGPWEWRGRE